MNNRDGAALAFVELANKIVQMQHAVTVSGSVSNAEMTLLLYLYRLEKARNPIYPSTISEALQVSRPTITAMLNSLENKDYIVRSLDSKDRRRQRVSIRPEGRKVLRALSTSVGQRVEYARAKLGSEKIDMLVELLRDALACIDEYDADQDSEVFVEEEE